MGRPRGWAAVAAGVCSEEAAVRCEVSPAVGVRVNDGRKLALLTHVWASKHDHLSMSEGHAASA